MPLSDRYAPDTSHATLGDAFYDPVDAATFPQHIVRYRNQPWAARVGLDGLTDAEWVDHLGRFRPLPGSLPRPLALRYHGHQFRSYNPELGDGRGFLFAQLRDVRDGRLLDLGTKGSGQTPWSRTADGRLTLKGGVREVLATSLLEALGVTTSKSFSLIETGEDLVRHDEPSPTRSAVLVRLNHSHVRIGTFQRLAYMEDTASLRRLLDYAVHTYFPEEWRDAEADRVVAFLSGTCRRVARMGAQWMAAGFVHGVLNTDNINVTGESFDYGPWRFLPRYDPGFTAAYFDHSGLYAYGRQPGTLLWNLVRLAECLLPLAPQASLEAALDGFGPAFHAALAEATIRRLGLASQGAETDGALSAALWTFMETEKPPFEQVFFDLFGRVDGPPTSPAAAHYDTDSFAALRRVMEGAVPAPWLDPAHPYLTGDLPCTMLIEEVEALWAPIAERDDWSAFHDKLAAVALAGQALGNAPAPP